VRNFLGVDDINPFSVFPNEYVVTLKSTLCQSRLESGSTPGM
jgi:hypothetical protein